MCAKIRTLLTCNHRRIRDPIQQLSLLSVLNDFYHVDQYKKRSIGDIELYSIGIITNIEKINSTYIKQ